MELSISEMLMIGLAIVVLFGPKKIPGIARDLGAGVRKMRGAMEDIKSEILKETDEPIDEIKNEIEKMKEAAKEYSLKEKFELDKITDSEIKLAKANELKDDHLGPVSR